MAKHRGGYLVTSGWQSAAKIALKAKGLSEKDLAKKVKCAQSTMHDLLNSPEARHSSLIPKINALFGWESPTESPYQPAPPLPSADALEAAKMFDLLPEPLRKVKIEELRAILAQLRPSND